MKVKRKVLNFKMKNMLDKNFKKNSYCRFNFNLFN